MYVTDTVKYVGVDDKTIDLFESQYVVPNGVSYNSYVILDDKIAVMDTVEQERNRRMVWQNTGRGAGWKNARLSGCGSSGAGSCRKRPAAG